MQIKVAFRCALLLLACQGSCVLALFGSLPVASGKRGSSKRALLDAIKRGNKEATADAVEDLLLSSRAPSSLSPQLSGAYKVLATLGGGANKQQEPAWRKYAQLLSTNKTNNKQKGEAASESSNSNYQIFSSKSNDFLNLSEYNGDAFFATASGTVAKLPNTPSSSSAAASSSLSSSSKRERFLATVNAVSIYINMFGKQRRLVIPGVKGTGYINVLYDDGDLRIVENEAQARAVQKRVEVPAAYKDLLA